MALSAACSCPRPAWTMFLRTKTLLLSHSLFIPWPCLLLSQESWGKETDKIMIRIRETLLSSGGRQRASTTHCSLCRGAVVLGARLPWVVMLARSCPATLHRFPRVPFLTPFLVWPSTEGESQELGETGGASLGKRISKQCCSGSTKPRVGRLLTGSRQDQRTSQRPPNQWGAGELQPEEVAEEFQRRERSEQIS